MNGGFYVPTNENNDYEPAAPAKPWSWETLKLAQHYA